MAAGAPQTLVLDLGKTSIKTCVVDQAGVTVASRRRDTPVRAAPTYPHFDVDAIYAWLLDALSELARDFDLRTIVPVAHGAAGALLAGDRLVLPVMDYEWPGVAEIDAAYRRVRPAFEQTRSPALPHGLNLGRQLYWLQHHQPEAFAAADTVLCYPQYWAWALSGAKATEVSSLGAHSDLWNPDARDFSSLVHAAGWRARFPALRRAWQTAGALRPEIAARTGLAPECVVKTGVHDSNASFLRHRVAHDKPFTVVSTGTWIICMAAGGDASALVEQRDMLANVDIYAEPVPSARFMGGREYAAIAGDDGLEIDPDAADVAAIIARATVALPGFAEAGGPFGAARGQIVGPAPQSARQRAALAALYCALVADVALSLLRADQGSLIVEGSFARNALFCRLLATLRDQPVEVSDDETGTVSGAALLASDAGPAGRRAQTRAVEAMSLPGLADYAAAWRRRAGAAL